MEGIKETNADIVVTACPGCMINLTDNTVRHKMPQKVYHWLDLLAQVGDGTLSSPGISYCKRTSES